MPSAHKGKEKKKRKKKRSFTKTNNGFKPRLAAATTTGYAQVIFFKSFMSEFRHSSPANHSVTQFLSMFKTNKIYS